MWGRAGSMIDEHERRVVLKITCERCHVTWHFRLRADRWDQLNGAEPTLVCMCGASFTVSPGKVGYVGRIPEPSVVATPNLRTEVNGLWECGGCGQRWSSDLEGEVQDVYMAESSNPTYICGCGSTLVLRQWDFRDAPLEATEQHPRQGSTTPLTDTERLVLEQMVDGKSNAEIARQLSLSEGTVRNVASSLYRKLRVKTRLQAANAAISSGLVQPHGGIVRGATSTHDG
jgi:DNA-binding CsgD family transcriptional regulator